MNESSGKTGHGGFWGDTGWMSTESRLKSLEGVGGPKGSISSEFPSQGTPQPAHMGSQSYSPSKEDDPTPNMKSFGNNKVID